MTPPSSPPPKNKELKDGRYTLLRRLGEGSQGETYEARDNGLARGRRERPRPEALADDFQRYVTRARAGEPRGDSAPDGVVAIKCFRLGKAKAWKDVELAEREARTLASLDHPRLPRYVEHFEEDGALYLVMERVEGESLAALRAKQRTLGPTEVTRMLEDLGDALRYLHGRAPFIVHRDIKPGNVIRRPDGSYALVDFGAVRDRLKPAGGSTVVGTFGYMAPEQFQGRASPKSDIYGLGATAIAMLTGCEPEELPHAGLGIDVARALPRGTSPAIARALTAMLQPDPDQRVDSIEEALAFLRAGGTLRAGETEKSSADAAPERLTRRQRRALRRQEKRETREASARARQAARARRPPFVPRLFAQLGLLVARIAVWATVGLLVPLVLVLLSLVFGEALRRAAKACGRAAERSLAALGRASSWVSGYRRDDTELAPRLRISPELARVRAVTEAEAQAIAVAREEARGEDAEAWIEARLAGEVDDELEAPARRGASAPPHGRRRG
ncbi:MAG: serine/threonine protein kinase [Labilithrix sp.]|nr:serine/threonine protein kinase [Labilithrix sp.]